MKSSGSVDLSRGRTRQKQRTRTALIESARDIIQRGGSPTVEEAAAAADISRTTAYRYFRNQAELLAAAHPETEKTTLLPADAPADPEARLEQVLRAFGRILLGTEAQQRTMLRLSLDPAVPRGSLPLRQGRAIRWLDDALAPLPISAARRRRLAIAIRSAIGIEAFVWLVDVAGLSRPEAIKTMRWSALAMLRAALAELTAV